MKPLIITALLIIAFEIAPGQEKMHRDTTLMAPIRSYYKSDTLKIFVMFVDESGRVRADSVRVVRSGYGSDAVAGFFDDPHMQVKYYYFSGNEFDINQWILRVWTGNREPRE